MSNFAVHKPKRTVIVRPERAESVTTVLPSALPFTYKGVSGYLAIPHAPYETNVLRTLGYNVPSPMNMYYEYEGKFKPFEAQRITAEFASMHERCFILNSMGLGKTITTLWALDYLRRCGEIDKALIVCPISVMERTWADEVFYSFPNVKANVLYGTREKRLKLLNDRSADIYIINTDGLKIIEEELASRPDINLVVIDEVALFRNSKSDRWRSANNICNKQSKRRVWGLTGSPMPNAPTDAFGQIKLVTPDNPDCPRYFSTFRDMTMLQISKFKMIPKAKAAEEVYRMMQPSIRFSLDDVVDLPPQIVVQRQVQLTADQKAAYSSMYNLLVAAINNGEITAVNEAVKASKLLQICCGVAYGKDEELITLNSKPRLEALNELVEESEGKVIVFVPFTGALDNVRQYLEEQGHEVAVIQGDTPKGERDEIFYNFQNGGSIRVIVANPATMSHGVTLTAATTIVWYGPCYSNEVYMQACARVRRPGQKRPTVIAQLVSSPIEARIYERLASKQRIQGILLDLVQEGSK